MGTGEVPHPGLDVLHARILACRACHEAGYLERANPISRGGRIGDRVMIVGQAPGPVTDRKGYHFAGPAGKGIETLLGRAGFPPGFFRQRCYLTSLTRCFPGKAPGGHGDRRPSPPELRLCRPFLDEELALLDPPLVLLIGQMAIAAFLGKHRLEEVVGNVFERDARFYVPLPHFSGVSRWLNDPAHRALVDRAIERLSGLGDRLRLT
ncbi:MAG: uracil-DNA glycosylase [Chloroflexi bacterium]|nr:uracil-DNA glycosylase [Chloroflexota bacterium]